VRETGGRVPQQSGDETAAHYETCVARFADLARSLTVGQLDQPVPATPGWTVRGVLSHLTAIPTDALAGRLAGIPTDEVTAGQIAERAQRSAVELLDEWLPNVPAMCDGARAGLVPPNLAVDVLTHEQDVRGALGLPPVIGADELAFCLTLYASGTAYRVRTAELPVLAVRAGDSGFERRSGDGPPAATLVAPAFELFRALAGRRSRSQVLRYDWTGDSEPYLDHLNVFGPLPDADVPD
jgi:uncharacterized protein (TIGR03083 family)